MSPQAQTVELPKRLPLVNNVNSRDGLFLKDARLVNAYAEKDETTGEHQINKRPGIGPKFSTLPNVPDQGQGQGLFAWQVFKAAGSSPLGLTYNVSWVVKGVLYNYSQNSGLQTKILNVAGVVGQVSFLQIPSQTTPRIFMSGASGFASTAMYYMGLDLIIHSVTSGVVFNTVPGSAYLNGLVYIMDVFGTIWNTLNANDPTIWDPLGKIQAISDNDYGVYLAKQLVYIVAIKQYSTLFFTDVGNPTGSPLAPVPGALFNFGCLDAGTVQNMDGALFWVTRSSSQPSQVIVLHDLQYTPISTPPVERMLDLSLGNKFYSAAFKRGGHKFYLLTNVTKNVSMVYDIGEKLWYLWTDPNGDFFPICSQTVDATGRWFVQRGDTGLVYQADSDYIYPNDQDVIFPVDIYTPNFDGGTARRKQMNAMFFHADQTPGNELLVRSSDDDYQKWTNFRRVNLGNRRPMITGCGSFTKRAHHFRHLANLPLRIRTVDLQLDLGTI